MALTTDRPSRIRSGRGELLASLISRIASPVPAEEEPTWAEASRRYRAIAIASDAVIAVAVTWPAAALMYPGGLALAIGVVVAALFVTTVALHDGYDTRRAASGAAELTAIARSGLLLAVGVMALVFVNVDLPRVAVITSLVLMTGGALALRLGQRSVVRHARSRGRMLRRTLLVGSPERLAPVLAELAREPRHGFAITGICPPAGSGAEDSDAPVVGTVEEVPDLIRSLRVETLVIAGDGMSVEELTRFRRRIEGLDVELLVAPNVARAGSTRVSLRGLTDTPVLSVTTGPGRRHHWGKAVLDRGLAAVLLLLAMLVLVPAAIAVRLTSRGAALFRQTRVGLNGRPFTMYKLRSMYPDAEARLAALEGRSDGNGTLFKMRRDPRTTPVGRFLRRFSIDELPQLWNVLRGDMSLVGPRPPLVSEAAGYDDASRQRLQVRPGLTGLWQVSGRSDLSWEESIRLDLRYVDNWTLTMDLTILWRTARAVLGGRGAY
ncbi:sugar transferase [Occultella glacieicola]|uniref:sugar transferase n=1 Tax=Occultella glacieicola TaxID=2518684 RepID=UPI0014052AB7|nr:sugar transferase [Occultella glacieicola]